MGVLALRTQVANKQGTPIARYRGALVFPRMMMFAKPQALRCQEAASLSHRLHLFANQLYLHCPLACADFPLQSIIVLVKAESP